MKKTLLPILLGILSFTITSYAENNERFVIDNTANTCVLFIIRTKDQQCINNPQMYTNAVWAGEMRGGSRTALPAAITKNNISNYIIDLYPIHTADSHQYLRTTDPKFLDKLIQSSKLGLYKRKDRGDQRLQLKSLKPRTRENKLVIENYINRPAFIVFNALGDEEIGSSFVIAVGPMQQENEPKQLEIPSNIAQENIFKFAKNKQFEITALRYNVDFDPGSKKFGQCGISIETPKGNELKVYENNKVWSLVNPIEE